MIQTLIIIDVKLTMENLWTDTLYGTLPDAEVPFLYPWSANRLQCPHRCYGGHGKECKREKYKKVFTSFMKLKES